MKIKIILTDDNGKTYEGEVNLNQTKNSTTIKSTKSKIKKKKRGGPKIQLQNLVEENFFQEPKSTNDILEELKTRSYHYKSTDLTKPLQDLVRDQVLRRDTLKDKEGKSKLHWVNW